MDAKQVGIADFGPTIPIKHRVDGFRQLSTASFIYTGCVNPHIVNAIAQYFFTASSALVESLLYLPFHDIFEEHFIIAPSMRQNSIAWDIRFEERIHLLCLGIKEPHDVARYVLSVIDKMLIRLRVRPTVLR